MGKPGRCPERPLYRFLPFAFRNCPSGDAVVSSRSIFFCTVDAFDAVATHSTHRNGPLGPRTDDGISTDLLSPR